MSVKQAKAKAKALANLALVKYFGKRDLTLNLPAAGSLSLTLEPLTTETVVAFDPSLDDDLVFLDGQKVGEKFAVRTSKFLDLVREMAGLKDRARVETHNDFPTAAGLASSASGFAALAKASCAAANIELSDVELSVLARRGSGSAARSIQGGICFWREGQKPDGTDSFASSICGPDDWDLRVIVAVTDPGQKKLGSTEAMELTKATSPFYGAWIETVNGDLKNAKEAVARRDLQQLGEIAEANALSMHAAALAARPSILYWNGATVEAIHKISQMRKKGLQVYFTCDAGPQPKALCSPADVTAVIKELQQLPGTKQIISCHLGSGASLI